MSRPWYYTNNNNPSTSTPSPHSTPSTPTTPSTLPRTLLSIPAIILLYTAAVPFTPISWLVGSLPGALLIDTFVAGIVLLCALYFQWKIATLQRSVLITLLNLLVAERSKGCVRNERVGAEREKEESREGFEFWWRVDRYWGYLTTEIALLAFAEYSGSEYMRRGIVLAVVAGLWVVGWTVTPRATKMWAWEHVKVIWFVLVMDTVRGVITDGVGRRRGRGRGRW